MICHTPARLALPLAALLALCCLATAERAPAADTPTTRPATASAHPETGVRIAQAWIRWLPANLPAGGYLTLVNERDQPAVLVAARSADYASVALHRTLSTAGTTRMVPVTAITIPAHATLDFASLGYHLMLMQARVPVKPGQQVPLTLQFADGGTLRLAAEVKPPTAESGPGHGGAAMPDMPGMSH